MHWKLFNKNSASMEPSPDKKKGLQKSCQTKENQKRLPTYQVGFSKFQPFT
jgi:hypothetical protein